MFAASLGCLAVLVNLAEFREPAQSLAGRSPYLQQIRAFQKDVGDHLTRADFAFLDATADDLGSSKARFEGGAWKLHIFFETFQDPNGVTREPGHENDEVSETRWQRHLSFLREWVKGHPASVNARVALAEALLGYAWHARGDRFWASVTSGGRRLFGERLAEAEHVLLEAKKLPMTCPQWYETMQRVALGQGWDLSRYNRLVTEGLKLEPLYYPLYTSKAIFLLPRWYGTEGDWEGYADDVSRTTGGQYGSMLYAAIVDNVANYAQGPRRFAHDNPGFFRRIWPKLKQGLLDRAALYGTNTYWTNNLCFYAFLAGDRDTVRDLLKKIEHDWDPEIWQTDSPQGLKNWAYPIPASE
jgi:hypothetical protein